jgi:hypothetical protein
VSNKEDNAVLKLALVEESGYLKRVEAEVARLTQEQGSGWQPIETAPKDGTNVLVWCPYRRIPVAATWQTAEFYWVELYQGSVTPTHWIPLPDPPAALASLPQEEP